MRHKCVGHAGRSHKHHEAETETHAQVHEIVEMPGLTPQPGCEQERAALQSIIALEGCLDALKASAAETQLAAAFSEFILLVVALPKEPVEAQESNRPAARPCDTDFRTV